MSKNQGQELNEENVLSDGQDPKDNREVPQVSGLKKAQTMAQVELMNLKSVFGAKNLVPNFGEINQNSARANKIEGDDYYIDEHALEIFSGHGHHGHGTNESRLEAIAWQQAKLRMNLLKMDRSFREQDTSRLSQVQRKQTMQKNMKTIDAFIPPEVKLRQKQAHDYQDFILKRQLENEGKEMCITNMCINSPFICCCFAYIVLIAVTGFAFVMNYFEISDQNYREFALWEDQRIIDWDMQEAAKFQLLQTGDEDAKMPVRSEKMKSLKSVLLYKAESEKNLLEKGYLIEIQQLEDEITSMSEWNDVCWAKSVDDKSCNDQALVSGIGFLKDLGIDNLKKASQDDINSAFYQLLMSQQLWQKYGYLFNHREQILAQGRVTYIRSFMDFGAPLFIDGKEYKDIKDNYPEQKEIVIKFQRKVKDKVKEVRDYSYSLVKPEVWSEDLMNEDFNEMAMQDTSYALISVALVFCYLTFHMWSIFLAFMGMILIATSFGVTAVIYELGIGVTYYSNLNNLVVFIVLGIAADDFFVFMDAWRQSETFPQLKSDDPDYPELITKKKRMAYTCRRATRAMFMTSSTTAVAFVANYFSPIMPIKAFGLFAAIIIPVNFLLVIWVFPSLIIFEEKYIKAYFERCCAAKKSQKSYKYEGGELESEYQTNNQQVQKQESLPLDQDGQAQHRINGSEAGSIHQNAAVNIQPTQDMQTEQPPMTSIKNVTLKPDEQFQEYDDVMIDDSDQVTLGRLEQFFGGPWNRCVFRCRYMIILFFVLWTTYAVDQARNISPLTEREMFLEDDHPILSVIKTLEDDFVTSSNSAIRVSLYWGVKDINKDNIDEWDPADLGEVVFDDKFDLSSKEAQTSILNLCTDLRSQTFVASGQVDCWVEIFDNFVREKYKTTKESSVWDVQSMTYQKELITYYEKQMPLEPEEFKKELAAFVASPTGAFLEAERVLKVKDGKLKYFEIYANSIGKQWDSYANLNPIYEQWEQYMGTYKVNAPEEMKSAKFTGGLYFGWIVTERAFVQSAQQGVLIAFIFAFIILTVVSCNMLLAIWSILSVAIVLVSVLAVMVNQGWELGVSESIAVVILIGLSVDYVVHLAQDYKHSQATHRSAKMKQAYQEMGVSIFSGTITTFLAGLALFGGQIITFQKFAVVICSTIVFSFLTSMCFFGALLHVFGPQHGWCDLCSCCTPKDIREFKKQQKEDYDNVVNKPANFFEMQDEGQAFIRKDDEAQSQYSYAPRNMSIADHNGPPRNMSVQHQKGEAMVNQSEEHLMSAKSQIKNGEEDNGLIV